MGYRYDRRHEVQHAFRRHGDQQSRHLHFERLEPRRMLSTAVESLANESDQLVVDDDTVYVRAITNNPYADVDWETTLRLKSQFHDHTNSLSRLQAYDAAGYDVVSYFHYSGNNVNPEFWTEHRWPVSNWIDQDDLDALANIKVFFENVEQIGDHHWTSPFVTEYLEKNDEPLLTNEYNTMEEGFALARSKGALPVLAHPTEQLLTITGQHANEIWNGFFYDEFLDNGDLDKNAQMIQNWDAQLQDNPRLFGVAVNDWYGPFAPSEGYYNPGDPIDTGYQVLLAESATYSDVKSAFSSGAMFGIKDLGATKGNYAAIDSVTVSGGIVTVDTTDSVAWISNGIVVGAGANYDIQALPADSKYLRAEVTNSEGSTVYVQPFEIGTTAVPTNEFTDWGAIAFVLHDDVAVTNDTWYRVEATSDGYLTIDASFVRGTGRIDLELYNSTFQEIDSGTAFRGTSRVDAYVAVGNELFFRVLGNNPEVDFRVTNLVSLNGSTVGVAGTFGDDTFAFTADDMYQVSVHGVTYDFSPNTITNIDFDGGAGSDTITLTGTVNDEVATLRVSDATLVGIGYAVNATDTEEVYAYGGGGLDSADLYDSVDDDSLTATPGFAELVGPGHLARLEGFYRVYSYSTSGGNDTAYLYDSAGDDILTTTSDGAWFSGDGFVNYVGNFSRVNAYSTSGGNDTAYLYDSAADDVLTATSDGAWFSGNGFVKYTSNFSRINVYSTSGGADAAYLYDSAGDDVLTTTPEGAWFSGADFVNYVSNFSRVNAYSTLGGNDTAYLYDSAADDVLTANPDGAWFSGDGFVNYASNFSRVNAYSTLGGNDTAYLYDSAGDDVYTATPDGAWFSGNGFVNYASNFSRVNAYSTLGGNDAAYLYDSVGDDIFTATPGGAWFTSAGYVSYAGGFGKVLAYAVAGGIDRAYLYDSTGEDYFNSNATRTQLSGIGYVNSAHGFEQVHAYSTGGYDRAVFESIQTEDSIAGVGTLAVAYMLGQSASAYGFDHVTAYLFEEESNEVDVDNIDYIFETVWI